MTDTSTATAVVAPPRPRGGDAKLHEHKTKIVAAAEAFLTEQGIVFEHVEYVTAESGRFDGLCYVYLREPDRQGAIARVLHVKLPDGRRQLAA